MVVNTGATNKESGCTDAMENGTPRKSNISRRTPTEGNTCLKASIFFNFILLTLLCGTGYYINYSRQKYCKMNVEYGKIEMEIKGLSYEVKGCNVYPVDTKPRNSETRQDGKFEAVSSSPRTPSVSNSNGPRTTPGLSKTRSVRPSEPGYLKTKSPQPSAPGFPKTRRPRPSTTPRKKHVRKYGRPNIMLWSHMYEKNYKDAMPMPGAERVEKSSK